MSNLEEAPLDQEPLDEEEGRFRLQFRVLMIGGARKAFRLEAVFWEGLEVLARRNGRTLAGEVEARLAAAPEHLNQSSALRTSLAGDLFDLWKTADARVARPQWASLVAAMPAPAFVISRRSVLLAANEPLLSYLQRQRPGAGLPLNTIPGALDLGVDTPPSAVSELVAGAGRRFVTCNVVFRTGVQRITCRVRLVPVEGSSVETPAVLGFVDRSDA
jgi:predicted DNA-binding ribbon-helix-helix protein